MSDEGELYLSEDFKCQHKFELDILSNREPFDLESFSINTVFKEYLNKFALYFLLLCLILLVLPPEFSILFDFLNSYCPNLVSANITFTQNNRDC